MTDDARALFVAGGPIDRGDMVIVGEDGLLCRADNQSPGFMQTGPMDRNRYGGAECRHGVSLERPCNRCSELLRWFRAGKQKPHGPDAGSPEPPQLWGAE